MPYIDVAEVAAKIITMYQLLLPAKAYSHVVATETDLGERLNLLQAIKERSISLKDMDEQQLIVLVEALRDAVCLRDISAAAKLSPFAQLVIENVLSLGPAGERAGYGKSGSQAQMDWTFQSHVQAALYRAGYKGGRDLKHDRKFTGKVCDFAVPLGSKLVELLECKRVHPGSASRLGSTNLVSKITDAAWLGSVSEQFRATEIAFGESRSACNHLIIDISAYSNESHIEQLSDQTIRSVGFSDESVSEIRDTVVAAAKIHGAIDQITLCWTKSLLIDGCFTALTQSTSVNPLHSSRRAVFRYEGWTVEGYSKNGTEYTEFRVSDSVRSLSRIIATYNNFISPHTFYTVGEEEVVQ